MGRFFVACFLFGSYLFEFKVFFAGSFTFLALYYRMDVQYTPLVGMAVPFTAQFMEGLLTALKAIKAGGKKKRGKKNQKTPSSMVDIYGYGPMLSSFITIILVLVLVLWKC